MADLTAQSIIERIQKNVGVPWKSTTVDSVLAGNLSTVVTGVATTWTPTLDVLHRAIAAKRNLIITRESPFWSRGAAVAGYSGAGAPPRTEQMRGNATYAAKNDLIQKNNLVIWRLSEHWSARKPDPQLRALIKALGWEKNEKPEGVCTLAETSLRELSRSLRDRFKIPGIRVIGAPDTKVRTVAVTHGFLQVPELRHVVENINPDVVLAGEPVEWEAGPYFYDLIASGKKKGMIVMGHQASEEPGSQEMAAWLKTIVQEVPVEFLAAGNPFWVPKKA